MVGTVFQHDEERNTEIRFDLTWPIDLDSPFDVIDTSLSTDDVVGATNVADQSDDFNFVMAPIDPLFVNAAGNNFLPADGSIVIDSAINSVNDRDYVRHAQERRRLAGEQRAGARTRRAWRVACRQPELCHARCARVLDLQGSWIERVGRLCRTRSRPPRFLATTMPMASIPIRRPAS